MLATKISHSNSFKAVNKECGISKINPTDILRSTLGDFIPFFSFEDPFKEAKLTDFLQILPFPLSISKVLFESLDFQYWKSECELTKLKLCPSEKIYDEKLAGKVSSNALWTYWTQFDLWIMLDKKRSAFNFEAKKFTFIISGSSIARISHLFSFSWVFTVCFW